MDKLNETTKVWKEGGKPPKIVNAKFHQKQYDQCLTID
jgi:hypothetical protein